MCDVSLLCSCWIRYGSGKSDPFRQSLTEKFRLSFPSFLNPFFLFSKAQFILEGHIMTTFSHENIVRLVGFCTQPVTDPVYLVMELMLYGDLKGVLLAHRHLCGTGEPVSWAESSLLVEHWQFLCC